MFSEEHKLSIETVMAYFEALGISDRILELDESSATVELAAHALGCEPCRIAKTLSFALDGCPMLVVMAGDAKVDNAKYKARFGRKATMLPREDAQRLIGHAVGGVCPFAVKEGVKVFLDESLRRVVSFSLPAEAATAPLSFPLRNWSGIRILRIG